MAAQDSQPGRAGRFMTLLVANATKVGGLYVAISTATKPFPNPLDIALAAFMMAGAQVSEDTILKLVGRMFGGHPPEREREQ